MLRAHIRIFARVGRPSPPPSHERSVTRRRQAQAERSWGGCLCTRCVCERGGQASKSKGPSSPPGRDCGHRALSRVRAFSTGTTHGTGSQTELRLEARSLSATVCVCVSSGALPRAPLCERVFTARPAPGVVLSACGGVGPSL
eukprot:scaffold32423_cov140-Isochrysis_galbana.AAC.6